MRATISGGSEPNAAQFFTLCEKLNVHLLITNNSKIKMGVTELVFEF